MTTRDQKGDFRLAVVKNFGISPGGQPLLFVVKKNASVLKNLLGWVNGILNGRKTLADIPLLVVDDEADHASVDTKAQAFDENGKPDHDHDPTKINGNIRSILTKFDKVAYVGYTATPFATIFIHDQGSTQKQGEDLFPRSFIINLPAPSNYDGPVRLFGLEPTQDPEGVPALPWFDDNGSRRLARSEETRGWMPPAHKKSHPRYNGRDDAAQPPGRNPLVRANVRGPPGAEPNARAQLDASPRDPIYVGSASRLRVRLRPR